MKYLFIFLVAFLLGILGVVGYGISRNSPRKPINNIVETVVKPEFSIANAPSESIQGKIKTMSGQVFWEPRAATEASLLKSQVVLLQGETIQTGENGNIDVEFPNASDIKIMPKTQIDFVQTLPVNFVASIASGSAEFKKLSDIAVTIRCLHLLIKNEGSVRIDVDDDKSLVSVSILDGSIITAYNDKDLNSHIANFNAPARVLFKDLTRTLSF